MLLILWLIMIVWLTPSALWRAYLLSPQRVCLDLPTAQFPYIIQAHTLFPPRKSPMEAEASSRHVPSVGSCGVQWLRPPALESETEVHSSSTTYLTALRLSCPIYKPLIMVPVVIVKRTMGSVTFCCLDSNPRSTSSASPILFPTYGDIRQTLLLTLSFLICTMNIVF